jgi:DNA replication protein DnaD
MITKANIVDFIITHWKVILIVVLALIVIGKTRYDYNLMQKTYKTQIQSVNSQIEGLKEIHKQEIQEKQKLMESHLKTIAEIEEEYEKATEELSELKSQKTNQYTNKFNNNKKALIDDIETKFGIEYVP